MNQEEDLDKLEDELKEEAEAEKLPEMKVEGRGVFELQRLKRKKSSQELSDEDNWVTKCQISNY